MCAGVIIHNLMDCQDIRLIGGLVYYLPLTSACFCVSNLALCGMPFLAGFYSKDLILEIRCFGSVNFISFFFYFFSTGLTACYTARLIYFTMFGNVYLYCSNNIRDEGWNILKGIFGICFIAVVGGRLLSWVMFPVPFLISLPLSLKLLALIVSVVGAFSGYLFSSFSYNDNIISMGSVLLRSFVGRM